MFGCAVSVPTDPPKLVSHDVVLKYLNITICFLTRFDCAIATESCKAVLHGSCGAALV